MIEQLKVRFWELPGKRLSELLIILVRRKLLREHILNDFSVLHQMADGISPTFKCISSFIHLIDDIRS